MLFYYVILLCYFIMLFYYVILLCCFIRVWEGANVDNHFDQFNLQTVYRVTYKSKEKYEGSFVDEYFHGVGSFAYLHGSKYEGTWHQGSTY